MTGQRPIILGIVGDSAAGKTTITKGLVDLLGSERVTHVCTDDYHKYDRRERAQLNITALHPDCNYLDILELQLERLHYGQPIKPEPCFGNASRDSPLELTIFEAPDPRHCQHKVGSQKVCESGSHGLLHCRGIPCAHKKRGGLLAAPCWPLTPDYSKTKMCFFAHISFRIFGHTVTLTSPRCAFRKSSIRVRDWPIPPPIESGIWSFRIAW